MNRLADDTFIDNEIGSQLIDDNLLLEMKSCTRSVFQQANDEADRDTARELLDQKAEMKDLCQGRLNFSTITTTTTTTSNRNVIAASVSQDEHQSTMTRQLMDGLSMCARSPIWIECVQYSRTISKSMGPLTELQAAKSMEQFISSQQDLDHSLNPIDHQLTGSKRSRSEITERRH